ncbi:sugar transferase [Paraliomyxa miuraensis]|uniref:sugar transferase n=1 Tax=Paraliomyxa miuraensis TaxID=376150 RepID=UPI00224E3AD2|nr:sugar transferase [Paraliomyxa miuraensis]MCX4240996.1 sugar transferase [Paraliomyxa miuraensis]
MGPLAAFVPRKALAEFFAMWRQKSVFLRQALIVLDVLVSAGAFVATLLVRQRIGEVGPDGRTSWVAELLSSIPSLDVSPLGDSDPYYLLLLGLLPLWALALYWTNANDFRRSYRVMAVRYARAVVVGLALLVVAQFLFRLDFISRSLVAMFATAQLGALMLGRVAVMETVKLVRRRSEDGHRVVIVGANERGVAFASTLQEQSPFNIQILGYVSMPGEQGHSKARPNLGYVGSLASLLDRQPVDEVVFAVAGRHPEIMRDAMASCEVRGVDVLVHLPPTVPSKGTMQIANVSGFDFPLLNLRRTPTSEARLAAKRILDFTGALIGIILTGPVMLITAAAIRITDPGPVLFRQVRAGRNGRKFTMLKFRSMVMDAEKRKAELMHLNEMDGPVFKIKRDPRITAVGRFIRKTSIDELPQLLNILWGDMSLVGPRPPLPSEVDQYEPWQRRRLSVKPGLTGMWQVSGRNQIDFDEWMKMDLDYIDNWSLWLDIKIILKTVPAVVLRSGAS